MSSRLLNLSVARVFYPTSVLGAEVDPEMPRMKSKTVLEGNDRVPQDRSGLGGFTME